ncbi:MAG: hypothetical protein J3K34DRAFT_182397 [Monoraphidium minutum]|nr:MAG: hypothetical protein J3K34DRAFT_182397 [Monoraphidium minutum]
MAPQGPAAARWASPRPPAAVAVSALAFALGLLLLAAAPAGAQVPAARPAAAAAMDNIKNVTCIVKKGSGDLANVKWANDAGKGGYMIKKGATETTSGFDSYTLSFLDSSISSTNLGYSKKPTPSWYLGFTTANGVYKYCGKMDKTAVPWASKADAPKLHASSSKKPGLALEKLGGGGCDKKTGVCKKAQTKYGGAMVLHDNDIRSQCKPSTIYVVYQRFMGATCYDMQQATENPRQTVSDLFMANYYTDFSWFCYKMPVGTGFCAPVLKCPSGWSLQLYSKSMGYCSDIWSKYKIKLEEFDAANAWTVASYMCTNLKDGETHLCLPNSVYCPDGTHQTSYTSSMGGRLP